MVATRWRRLKDRYGYGWDGRRGHPEVTQAHGTHSVFAIPKGYWAGVDIDRKCSCWMCSWTDEPPRTTRERAWRDRDDT